MKSSISHERRVANVQAKRDALRRKEILLDVWENTPDADHEYVIGLRARVRSLRNQLTAMMPIKE